MSEITSNFMRVSRTCTSTGEKWFEVFELESIEAIVEHRICKQIYSNDPGKRRGYDVVLKSGYKFWINDQEYEKIIGMLNICNI